MGGSDGATGNELNWNGNLSEVSSGIFRFTGDGSNDFRHMLIDDYTRLGGLILGKDESTVPIEIETKIDVRSYFFIWWRVLWRKIFIQLLAEGIYLLKVKVKLRQLGSRNLQTNNGDITFWADSDGNGEGNIILADDNTINSASGRTGDTDSSGGNITFGGGNNSGVIPNGNAVSSNLPGVKLGTTTANDTQIYSGGGNISIKGESTATSLGDDRDEAGIYQWGKMTMKSGRGAIIMQGLSSTFTRGLV